jgi:tetratricopeptide (TPR) repeat protein
MMIIRQWSLVALALISGLAFTGRPATVMAQAEQSEPTPLFADDFAEPTSGWETVETPAGRTGYSDGTYSVTALTLGQPVWGRRLDYVAANPIISVTATPVSSSSDQQFGYGAICRTHHGSGGYFLGIRGDGHYAIQRIVNGEFDPIVDWTPSDAIAPGLAENQIEAACEPETLRLTVNGTLLIEVAEAREQRGQIGLAAVSWSEDPAEIRFDDLVVTTNHPPPRFSLSAGEGERRVTLEVNFDEPDSWEVGEYGSGSAHVTGGVYAITAAGENHWMWGVPYHHMANIVVEVEATSIDPPAAAQYAFGIGCRIQWNGDGLYFLIRENGEAALAQVGEATVSWVIDWQARIPLSSSATHRLTVVCEGPYAALLVDGALALESVVEMQGAGDIALVAVADGPEPATIHFDNLTVASAEPLFFTTPDGIAMMKGAKGVVLSEKGDAQGAIMLFEQAASLWQEMGVPMEAARTYTDIAITLERLFRYEEALPYYEQALAIWQDTGVDSGTATTLNAIGRTYRAMFDTESALDAHLQELAIRRKTGDQLGEAYALAQIASAYDSLGEHDRALDTYEQALPIWQEMGDEPLEAPEYETIRPVDEDISIYEQDLAYYEAAMPAWYDMSGPVGEANTLRSMALVHVHRRDYASALDYYDQALVLWRAGDYRRNEAATLTDIGKVFLYLYDYEQALSYFEQALSIDQEEENANGMARALHFSANAYRSLADYEQALAHYEQALDIEQDIGNRLAQENTLRRISQLHAERADYERALVAVQQALELAREIGDYEGEAACLNGMGVIYQVMGDDEQALFYYRQAWPGEAEGTPPPSLDIGHNMGVAFARRGDHERAMAYLQRSLEMTRETDDREGEAATLHSMGVIAAQRDELDQAVNLLEQAHAIWQVIEDRRSDTRTLARIPDPGPNGCRPYRSG